MKFTLDQDFKLNRLIDQILVSYVILCQEIISTDNTAIENWIPSIWIFWWHFVGPRCLNWPSTFSFSRSNTEYFSCKLVKNQWLNLISCGRTCGVAQLYWKTPKIRKIIIFENLNNKERMKHQISFYMIHSKVPLDHPYIFSYCGPSSISSYSSAKGSLTHRNPKSNDESHEVTWLRISGTKTVS